MHIRFEKLRVRSHKSSPFSRVVTSIFSAFSTIVITSQNSPHTKGCIILAICGERVKICERMIYDNYAELVEVERKYVDTKTNASNFSFCLFRIFVLLRFHLPRCGNGVTKIIIYVTAIGYLCKQWKNALWSRERSENAAGQSTS